MRRAIKNKITPPAICNASGLKFMTRRKLSPMNMKTSSRANAIKTSRKMTRGLRLDGTFLKALAKIGMLPNGSVMSSSKIVAEAKV